MAERNFPDNAIHELDNLDVLRGMNSETVDLIATDPPFNARRNRAGKRTGRWKWENQGSRSSTESPVCRQAEKIAKLSGWPCYH